MVDFRTVHKSLALLVLAVSAQLAQAQVRPPQSVPVNSSRVAIQMFSRGVGWALINNRVYWTRDDGGNWVDVTPSASPAQTILGVFFLDPSNGVVSITDATPGGNASNPLYLFATTNDGGKKWITRILDTSKDSRFQASVGAVSISFANPRHGWAMFQLPSSSNFSMGGLFSTQDGGISWTQLPSPPGAGSLRLLNVLDGWLVGGVGGYEIWATHDGGMTWSARQVPRPTDCSQCQTVFSGPPVFHSRNHATLVARIEGWENQRTVTYVTNDGGDSWEIAELAEDWWGPASIVGDHVISAAADPQHGLRIRVGGATKKPRLQARFQPVDAVAAIEFADDNNGWIVQIKRGCAPGAPGPCSDPAQQTSAVELLSTNDGGASFRIITPPAAWSRQVAPR